ncbi:MAG: FG-GAP-like repeat-containing protein [Bacteroidota bacterium]
MKFLSLLCSCLFPFLLPAQLFQGTVSEAYQLSISRTTETFTTARSQDTVYQQLAGFPLGFRADGNTKNFRNITLADLNQDGIEELIFAANNLLFAYQDTLQLWRVRMTGTGIYPPSVADLDGDGDLEIVQVTGGNAKRGQLYVVDHEGNDLMGFPKSYNNNWLLTSPTLSDLDDDGQLEIIFLERNSPGGNIHILNHDGSKWSDDWPVRLPGTPAITPSIADIDNDGAKEIVVSSTTVLYAFDLNGEFETGWPVDNPDTKFSFQSPILTDLDGDLDLEIIGATHGNQPEYYILHHDGTPYKAWPFFVPEGEWTFSTPTLINLEGTPQILMSRPKRSESLDMLYAWNEAGDLRSGFPLENNSGAEGIITVADIDDQAGMEVIVGSNLLDEAGFGFISAFHIDGSGLVDGFPLRPRGWTLMNGATIGDVNNDGNMDLIALSYTTNFGAKPDSIFINAYDLNVSYGKEKILWNTYKGNNRRDGDFSAPIVSSLRPMPITGLEVTIFPNPISQRGSFQLTTSELMSLDVAIYSTNGQLVQSLLQNRTIRGTQQFPLPYLADGIYLLKVENEKRGQAVKKLVVTNK